MMIQPPPWSPELFNEYSIKLRFLPLKSQAGQALGAKMGLSTLPYELDV